MKQETLRFDDIFCFDDGNQFPPLQTKTKTKTKTISKRLKKRLKREDFSYDLDKLGFTIGITIGIRHSPPTKVLKKPQKFIGQCCQNKECYYCHGGVWKKASPDELLYRDLFVKPKSLKKDDDDTCAICLRSFIKQRFVWKLACNHYFHYECIEKWSDMKHYTCPLCRQEYYHP